MIHFKNGLAPSEFESEGYHYGGDYYEADDKAVFHYYVEQLNESNIVTGGEEYYIHRDERPIFYADAGADENINQGETMQLQTAKINEPAQYNWYNEEGKLFYSGTDTSFIPTRSQKFILEILALKDGYKDYDEKKVNYKENFIQSVSPNPININQTLAINYITNKGTNLQFIIENISTNNNHVYSASVLNTTTTISVNNLTTGNYILKMILDGVVVDSQQIIINN